MNSKANSFIQDVKSGMADQALQRKYGMSRHKLLVYKAAVKDFIAKERRTKISPRKKISAQEFLKDLRANMDDAALIGKYCLNGKQLQNAFRKLIKLGLATPLELSQRLSITKSQVADAFKEMGKAIAELD